MLPPSESLRDAAAVILEHLRTDGTLSRHARETGLCGYVVWPKASAGEAPDLLYQQIAVILAEVADNDPIITQTAWGSVLYNDTEEKYIITAETAQGEIAITQATHDIKHEGVVFWFDQDALASLQALRHNDSTENAAFLSYAVLQASR